jgi:hypothetical protein
MILYKVIVDLLWPMIFGWSKEREVTVTQIRGYPWQVESRVKTS